MRRLLVALGLLAPALVMLFLRLVPGFDPPLQNGLGHFYVVTFTSFAAAVIAILLTVSLGRDALPRHVLAATALALIGSVFFTHGLATQGAMIDHFHPAIGWSAWLTLFGGGALFLLAGLDGRGVPGPAGRPALPVRSVVIVTVAAVAAYFAIALFAPDTLTRIQSEVAPWHQRAIFGLTEAFWLLAAFLLADVWRRTRSRTDGALAFVAFWLAQATVSMHWFPVWNLSWWLYHFILLVSFLITATVLLRQYERAREFRLVNYYVAVALVMTALLALLASYLYGEYSYRARIADLETSNRALVESLIANTAHELPPGASRNAVFALYGARLSALAAGDVNLYTPDGIAVYPPDEEGYVRTLAPAAEGDFKQALAGTTRMHFYEANEAHGDYGATGDAPVLTTYAPLVDADGARFGVAVLERELPELEHVSVGARVTALLLSALTMGLLFAALLTVVLRADRIITARTAELSAAYADLRRAEGLRDDLTNMVVHDLRNPLTAISASLDLLGHPQVSQVADMRERFVGNARGAVRRMAGLVDDILTVSKIEAGELKLQPQPVALAALLDERVKGFLAQAEVEGKRFSVDCPDGLTVTLDPALIGRVIDNLIGNALKYTGDAGHIALAAAPGAAGDVRVHVRDDGEGVPDAYKTVIFDKFSVGPDATAARKGTGLGLAFCRLVVEAHGGRIWVEDAPDGGSDFIFTLPA